MRDVLLDFSLSERVYELNVILEEEDSKIKKVFNAIIKFIKDLFDRVLDFIDVIIKRVQILMSKIAGMVRGALAKLSGKKNPIFNVSLPYDEVVLKTFIYESNQIVMNIVNKFSDFAFDKVTEEDYQNSRDNLIRLKEKLEGIDKKLEDIKSDRDTFPIPFKGLIRYMDECLKEYLDVKKTSRNIQKKVKDLIKKVSNETGKNETQTKALNLVKSLSIASLNTMKSLMVAVKKQNSAIFIGMFNIFKKVDVFDGSFLYDIRSNDFYQSFLGGMI